MYISGLHKFCKKNMMYVNVNIGAAFGLSLFGFICIGTILPLLLNTLSSEECDIDGKPIGRNSEENTRVSVAFS